MMHKNSKATKILNHLKEHGKINPMEALEQYGCFRLAAVIFCLRKDYDIKTLDTESTDRFGNKVTYATYVLEG